jgi:hypothetical protein
VKPFQSAAKQRVRVLGVVLFLNVLFYDSKTNYYGRKEEI